MEPYISEAVLRKLATKHQVAVSEVIEAFANRQGRSLIDNREDHRTDPPTRWFVSETNMGRKLKIVYILADKGVELKTAYEANATELSIYQRVASVSF